MPDKSMGYNVSVNLDTRKAEARAGAFASDIHKKISAAIRSLPNIEIDADSTAAQRRIAEIRRELTELRGKRIGVDIDAGAAQARIARLSAELTRLGARSPSIQVQADTARASAQLLGVSALANRLDGKTVAISVNASDVSRAISLLGLLTAGLAGVSAVGAPAIAALAGISSLTGAAVQGVGAVAAGFSGIGDAVKALSDQEAKAASTSTQAAASRASAADRVASAQSSLQRAQTAADRAAITGAQQVADANRAVRAAEQDLTRAQQASRDAQEDLTRAHADAREEIENLALSLRGAALSEEDAGIRLAEAQEALVQAQAAGTSGRDLQKLDLDARQAALALDEARERHEDLRLESERSAQVGVEGSDRVVAAHERVADTAQQVSAAEERLAQAREQVGRAQQQALWAQQDAAMGVADAQRQMAAAMRDTGDVGSAAVDKVAQAMSKLSPEGQKFAAFLAGELLPQLREVRNAVQAGLLPGVEAGLRDLGQLTPLFSAGLKETGQVIGDLTAKGARMMTSGPWQRDFATILDANNRILGNFGEAGLDVADSMRSVTVTSLPMMERLSEAVERGAELANQWMQTKRATGEAEEFFDAAGDTIAELVHIMGQLVGAGVRISQALGPLGMVLLEAVGHLAEFLGQLAEASPLLTQTFASLVIGAALFNKIGTAVAGVGVALPVMLGGWRSLLDLVGKFSPSAIAASATMQRVAAGLNAAELAAGRYTDRLFTSTAAQERANTAGARLGTVATKIGSALPIVGAVAIGAALAYDELAEAADEAAGALLRGGSAAAEQAQALRENDAYVASVQDTWFKWIPVIGQVAYGIAAAKTTTEEATAAMRDQLAAMTPLQAAQTEAARATNTYGLMLKEYGPNSWQAASAAGLLALATGDLEKEQNALSEATKTTTERIVDQRNQMLGNIDTEIRYEAALDALTESVQVNGASTDKSTEAGRANLSALTDLSRAAVGHIDALAKQGATQDEITAKTDTYRQQLYNAALQIGMNDAEARKYADSLKLGAGVFAATMTLDTSPAAKALREWILSAEGQQVTLKVGADTGNILGGRAAGGIDGRPMAAGGFRAMVVPARTPTLIGDHPRVPESYIPLDPGSPRSHRILDVSAAAMGRRILPMAAGGMVQAEDGSWVHGPSFYSRTSGPNGAPYTGRLPEGMPADATKAFRALADVLRDRLTPALDDATRLATEDTPEALKGLTGTTTESATTMGRDWDGLRQRIQDSADGMRRTMLDWQATHNASWMDMRTRSGVEIGAITGPQMAGLHAGMDATQEHAARMAGAFGEQFSRLRALTADPIRWSLTGPINAGLVPAWNAVQSFFALNRPMGPVPIGFHTGGTVPGSGSGDTVPIMATPGEEVIRKEIATPTRRFLQALNSGQAEAVQAAGGRFARFALGGTVEQGLAFAKAQHGKPYIWGGVGPAGFDCSGYMSAISNTLMGRPPYQRIGTTGSAPWPGFSPGLNSSFGIGFFKGNPGHMSGTLAGSNVESGGSPSMVKFVQNAAGATHPQFRGHMSLPQVGGRFIAGGPSGFDPGAYLAKEFAATRKMIAEIGSRFGPGNPPYAMTRFGNDATAGATDSFDGGGVARGRGLLYKHMIRPERMLSGRQTEAFEQLTRVLGTVRGSNPIGLIGSLASGGGGGGLTPAVLSAALERAVQRFAASLPQPESLDGATLRIEDDGRGGLARITNRQNRLLDRSR